MVCEKLVTVKILFLGESVVTVFPFILSNTLGELMFAYLSGKQYTKKSRNVQYHSVIQLFREVVVTVMSI